MPPSDANRWNYDASIKLGDGMNDTSSFFLLTLTTTIAVSVFVVLNRSVVDSGRMARVFCILCLVLGLAAFITTIFAASGLLSVKGAFGLLFRLLIVRGWIVIGTGVSSALLMPSNAFVRELQPKIVLSLGLQVVLVFLDAAGDVFVKRLAVQRLSDQCGWY